MRNLKEQECEKTQDREGERNRERDNEIVINESKKIC